MRKEPGAENSSGIDWSEFDDWTELLDALCLNAGHAGNADLAFAMCGKLGKKSLRDHETMTRNIGNWRNGANYPSRRNFRVLSDILNVKQDAALRQRWTSLYAEATSRKTANLEVTGTKIESDNTFVIISGQRWKQNAALLGVFSIVVVTAFVLITRVNDDTIDARALFDEYKIVWRDNVTMRVGEKVVIHGARGDCGQLPAANHFVRMGFPDDLKHGTLDVGKLGARNSHRCGGPTPAVEVFYEANSPGVDEFVLYGDPVRVTVLPGE